MFRKLLLILLTISFSCITFSNVFANEEVKTVWLEVVLDSSCPDGFNHDISLTLSNDKLKRTYTLFQLNDYKDNYELLPGTYDLKAYIIDDQLELYRLINVPNKIVLEENTSLNLIIDYNFSEMKEIDRMPKEKDNESYVKPEVIEEHKKNDSISSIIESAVTSVCILGSVGVIYLYMKHK